MGLINETNAQYYSGQQDLGAITNTIGYNPQRTFQISLTELE
eukprot:COSAG02_NODE_4439_length_5355_cov_12.764650_1_plen_42_part_00